MAGLHAVTLPMAVAAGGEPTDRSVASGVPSFRVEVMAVLSKGGCNAGGCHGAPSGKGGLQLSLFGADPAADFAELHETRTRLDLQDPERSWLLRKPALEIEHEGGQRFALDSEEYRILRAWIAGGAPDDGDSAPRVDEITVSPDDVVTAPSADAGLPLSVTARFTDGSVRDVTRWAVYEPSDARMRVDAHGVVRAEEPVESTVVVSYLQQRRPARLAFVPVREDFVWKETEPTNFIDALVFAKLRRLKIHPAERCSDATFVRRAHLDLTGRLPEAEAARAFVASGDPHKRKELVDRLLHAPEFAEFWALKWADLLKVEEKTLDAKGVAGYHAWIRDSLAEGKPLDRFVTEVLTGRGSTYAAPASNFYRALRDPASRAEAAAQVFLGTRLQCVKCHNHPFEKWTQDDYYRFSALFDGIDYQILENKRKDQYDKNQFVGEQIVRLDGDRVLHDPRDKSLPVPGLLEPEAAPLHPDRDRFEQVAEWITSPNNRQFARVQANRIWFHLLGIGIVDPVDDFRSTNPASNPALLEALADELVASGYDLRHLVRTIMQSRTYQASSAPAESGNETLGAAGRIASANFAHAAIVRLSAEQLLDAVGATLSAPTRFRGYEEGTLAVEVPGVEAFFARGRLEPGDRFLALFGKPQRLLASDMERSRESTLAQVFELTSSEHMHDLLSREDNRIAGLLHPAWGARGALRELYWTAVSRAPTPEEEEAIMAFLGGGDEPPTRAALEDIAWSLINSKEFLFRH